MRTISQLFYETDVEDITDEEFDKTIIPYFREQRAKFKEAEARGGPAPRQKRVDVPKNLDLKDLDLSNLKL